MADVKTDEQPESLAHAAADTLVRELATYAVMFGITWAVLHRDAVTRAWMRIRHRPVSPAKAREMRLLAELRRAMSAYEHSSDRAATVAGGGGLYDGRPC